MRKHPLKNIVKQLGLAAMIAILPAVGAHAFTETKIPPQASSPAPQVAPNLNLDQPKGSSGLDLSTPGDGNSDGTELNIPGVGTIGKLPKLDFGLELLYGSGGEENPAPEVNNGQDDVLIKGKIRHRF